MLLTRNVQSSFSVSNWHLTCCWDWVPEDLTLCTSTTWIARSRTRIHSSLRACP
jgi:hypothetical protein